MRRQWIGRRVALGLVVSACCVASASAAPGEGARVGDAVLSPSLATGLEFHSNAYLTPDETIDGVQQPVVPGLIWYLRPRLGVGLDGEKLTLDFDGGYALKQYIDLDAEDDANVANLSRYTDFDARLGMGILPRARVGFRLDDAFSISSSPWESFELESGSSVVHTRNDLSGGFLVRPGSSLELGAKGHFGFDNYDLPPGGDEGSAYFNSRMSYGPLLQMKWSFLPKTALVGEVATDWLVWNEHFLARSGPDLDSGALGTFVGKPDSLSWRTRWGLRGQLTPKFAVIALLGYGQAYYDEQTVLDDAAGKVPASSSETAFNADGTSEDFAHDLTNFGEGFLADVQFGYAPLEGHKLSVGYRKDFGDAVFTNYSVYHYAYLRYAGAFAKRFALTAEAGYRNETFHGEVNRGDQVMVLKASASYALADFLAIGVQGGWNARQCQDADCEGGEWTSTEYSDAFGQIGLTAKY